MGGPALRGGHRLCRETPVAQRLIASTDVARSEYQQSRPPTPSLHFPNYPSPGADPSKASSRERLSNVALNQFTQSHAQGTRNREQFQHRWVVDAAFEPAHDIRMNARLVRQGLLAEIALFAPLPNLIAKTSKDRSRAHAQGLIFEQDTV